MFNYIKKNFDELSQAEQKIVIGGIGLAIACVIADGVLIATENPTIEEVAESNPDFNRALNDEEISERAKSVEKLEGQEKIEALEDLFAEAVYNNPNIPAELKPEVIIGYSYNVLQKDGDKFDEEMTIRMLASASTVVYEEIGDKIDPKYSRIIYPQ